MIVRDAKKCYGCGNCALACSFHHKKVLSPELSSIKVLNDLRTGQIEWTVDFTCDQCRSEPEPLCVKYCAYRALSVKEGRNDEE